MGFSGGDSEGQPLDPEMLEYERSKNMPDSSPEQRR